MNLSILLCVHFYKPEAQASESFRFSFAFIFTSPKRKRVNLFDFWRFKKQSL